MHIPTPRRPASAAARPRTGAITWIDRRHAVVARTMPSGSIDVTEVPLAGATEPDPAELTRVTDLIGDRERVLVLGPRSMRTALERQYVAISHRPDRILDREPVLPLSDQELVELLRDIAG